ncbi:MAG TPA: DUF5060 domain-containing protein, partial [Bryobacteraceae bacterium]
MVILPLMWIGRGASAAGITLQRRGQGEIAAYQRVEFEVALDRTYANPFDPDEISVDATITGPDGKHLIVPGFWGQDFPDTFQDPRGISAAPTAAASFRVRFAPTCAGRWEVTVAAKDQQGLVQSTPVAIDVASSASTGFVRVAPENHAYLQFDSGAAYFPIGLNLAWTNGSNEKQFVDWFDRLHAAGGNFARVWLCHPPVRIESEKSGLGRYDLRNAAYFDDLLALAERDGLRVMLTINNHRELLDRDMWGLGQWGANPYNAANGGPATMPIDFFTSPAAR